ncbi:hypothetical protein JHK86_042901 [Glycine max]|nr:hypothetical protein JHK86_042901 [Glycine max]
MEGANNINQVRGDSFEKKDKSIENSNMIGKTIGLGRDVELHSCVDYDNIKTFNGKIYVNFLDACYALGLLMDDREYIGAIKEASQMGSRNQLRRLFVTMLFMNTMTKLDVV